MRRRSRFARRRDGQRRSFRIYHGPFHDSWRWECSMCDPPAYGQRCGPDAWLKIVTISMPHHFRVRDGHHRWIDGKGRRL